MSDFLVHKEKFLRFLDTISNEDRHVGIVSHANCVDGLASAVLMVEILKKEKPFLKIDIAFITYTSGILDNISEKFENLGIKKLKLITNNPAKLKYVESLGVEIVERIPAIIKANKYNELYLSTKKEKMGHLI